MKILCFAVGFRQLTDLVNDVLLPMTFCLQSEILWFFINVVDDKLWRKCCLQQDVIDLQHIVRICGRLSKHLSITKYGRWAEVLSCVSTGSNDYVSGNWTATMKRTQCMHFIFDMLELLIHVLTTPSIWAISNPWSWRGTWHTNNAGCSDRK